MDQYEKDSPFIYTSVTNINILTKSLFLTEITTMKLYSVSDGPPSLAVRMTLKALNIPFELVDVIFNNGEHLTEEYAKVSTLSIIKYQMTTCRNFLYFVAESPKRDTSP